MSIPQSIWWGLGVGAVAFSAFFAFEFSIERREERAGSYVTLTPFKMRRDRATGKIVQDDEEVDFDPRHGHYMK